MLAMGFEQQLHKLQELLPSKRQTMLLSATFPPRVEASAEAWLSSPFRFQVGANSINIAPNVEQVLHVCAEHKKPRKLAKFIQEVQAADKTGGARQRSKILVFCNKIKTVAFVKEFIYKQRWQCVMLHGELSQKGRDDALASFRCGKIPILVCTDVAARGLHVRSLQYVVNYDFPSTLEVYAHRIVSSRGCY